MGLRLRSGSPGKTRGCLFFQNGGRLKWTQSSATAAKHYTQILESDYQSAVADAAASSYTAVHWGASSAATGKSYVTRASSCLSPHKLAQFSPGAGTRSG